MKHKHVLGILVANLFLIIAGGAFLYWYYEADGYWWNPPIFNPQPIRLRRKAA